MGASDPLELATRAEEDEALLRELFFEQSG